MVQSMSGGVAGGDERLRRSALLGKFLRRPELGAVGGAVLVFLFFGVVAGRTGMFSPLGIINFLEVSALLGILAVAVALLMIGGEFALSIGSMVGAAGVVLVIPVAEFGGPLWVFNVRSFRVPDIGCWLYTLSTFTKQATLV